MVWYLVRDTSHLCRSFSSFLREISLKFILLAESDREWTPPTDESMFVNYLTLLVLVYYYQLHAPLDYFLQLHLLAEVSPEV